MTGTLNALMAEEHLADLTRAAARRSRIPSRPLPRAGATVELRPARPGDEATLRRLAALDEAPALQGPVLLALVEGEAVAALAVDDGRVVANPFVPSGHAVSLLRLRAAHLSNASGRRRRRIRLPRLRLA
ncbi:MAG TPA: hypothetical protein VE571_14070 [Solirubrobacteraceae bacterium]|nr:hypothetical protein [Solirubrobacteraceae bacterium]